MSGGKARLAGDAIRVEGLSKLFRRTSSGHQMRTLKSALLQGNLVQGLKPEEGIPAVQDVSFRVGHGEAVGLIGSNGSGKSTLLKVVAGILKPTAGTLEVNGRVAALIELGAGFHPEISGRENIYINGAVLGLSRKELDERFDSIVEFSGLASFIDEPVKNYSSGMYVRLGFAVAIHTDPDVLMVDEVLSVGDEAFAHRCLRRIQEFLGRGRTLLLVSHSLDLIEVVCDRAIWLEKGKLRLDGHPRRVIDAYRAGVAADEAAEHREAMVARQDEQGEAAAPAAEEATEEPGEVLRWGSRVAEIERLRVLAGEEERYHFRSGEDVAFEIVVHAHQELDDFVFGVAIATPRGHEIWGTNTDIAGYLPERLPLGRTRLRLECPGLRLGPGEYLIDVAVHARDGNPYDYRRKLAAVTVTAAERGIGVYFPEHRWTFGDGIVWKEKRER
jgi:ABC-type polysaccharide/polyol phosphate transport system ATPase subunit